MGVRISKFTLRDLLWLILLAAVAIGWWVERNRALKQLASYGGRPGGSSTYQKSPAWFQRNKLLIELRNFENAKLQERLQRFRGSKHEFHDEFHACLLEMVRRGMHTELQTEYDAAMDEMWTNELRDKLPRPSSLPANAHLLTALRHAQGKPDPLQIDLEVATTRDPENQQSIPEVRVTVKNVDTEDIGLTHGGDYRSGRQTRFRVQLTNEQGVRVPDANFSMFGPGGGISSFGSVKPGHLLFDKTPLDARKYVSAPPTGRYQLQVIYGEQEIATEPDVDGLIVWQSKPILVQVENRMREQEQRISLVPLISILLCAAIAHWIFEQSSRWRKASNQGSPPSWFNGRDWAALVALLLLLCGWFVNLQELSTTLDAIRPYNKAEWSMKIVEPN